MLPLTRRVQWEPKGGKQETAARVMPEKRAARPFLFKGEE